MSQHVGVVARRAFQQKRFLLVDAGPTQTMGVHQYRPLVDDDRSIRTVGSDPLPSAVKVGDLTSHGYSIPRLFDAKAQWFTDTKGTQGVMQYMAGLCAGLMQRSDSDQATKWRQLLGERMADGYGPISAVQFVKIAADLADVTRDSILSIEINDGAVYVNNAEVGAQIFVELGTDDSARAPQNLFTNGMYTCKGNGPVHLIGGADVLITSRSSLRFAEGIQEDRTEEMFAGSGMPAEAVEDMRLQITQEDSTVVFLQQGVAEGSLPIPNHGVMMRAVAGAIGIWEGNNLIHVLEAGNGTTLLCHPEARMVQLKATTPDARLLKVSFKLS